MRQSAATNWPSLVRTSGLISSDRASTLRAALNNFRIDSPSCFPCANGSPDEATASVTAESTGPPFTSQAMRRVAAARSSIPLPPPAAKIITGARVASSIANERKNSRSMSIFSSTSTASTRNCPTFIDNMRAAWPRTAPGFVQTAAPGRAGLALDAYACALLVRGEFLGHDHRFISGRHCPAARNLESVGGENCFALILVKSCHGSVLLRIRTLKDIALLKSQALHDLVGLLRHRRPSH